MSDFITVYCTFPTLEDARTISRALVEGRLVACANILPVGQSLYWWKGAVQNEDEVYALYKTTKDKFAAVEQAIVARHPYEVPCVVALPITDGHAPYLEWIKQETA